ncbi:MAG: hypothetical protein KDD47_21330 [Acidobacteria bacterium]|nr:hypothetical protein [Acidobacteriota bacterium]
MTYREVSTTWRRALATGSLAALLLGFHPTPAAADHCDPLPEPTLRLGFNGQAFWIQNDFLSRPNYTQRFVDEYLPLSAQSIRLGIDWQVLEPNPGDRNFEGQNVGWNYTAIVEAFRAQQVEVQGMFNTFPAWVTESTDDDDDGSSYNWDPKAAASATPENLAAMTQTVRETLVHFYLNGCIRRWEFTNEPSREIVPVEGGTAGSIGHPVNYAVWLAAFLDGVSLAEADLAAAGEPVDFEIALGAIDGTDIDNWTNGVLTQPSLSGRAGEIDAIAFHPYDREDVEANGLSSAVLGPGLAAADQHDLEVWITEFGYNDESGGRQRDKLCYAVSWMDAQPRIIHANLHLLHDIDSGDGCQLSDANRDPNCFGLINNDFVSTDESAYDPAIDRKKAWTTYRLLEELLLERSTPLAADGSDCAPAAPTLTFPVADEEVPISGDGAQITFTWDETSDPFDGEDGTLNDSFYQFTLFSCQGDDCSTAIFASAEQPGTLIEAGVNCGQRYRWALWARSDESGVPGPTAEAFFTTACEEVRAGALDFCFAVDTTGSMGPYIAAAKVAATAIVGEVFEVSSSPRVAVTDYRDYPLSPWGGTGDYPFNIRTNFSTDQTEIVNGIQSLNLGFGADFEESVYAGLIGCILGRPGFFYTGPSLDPWRAEAIKAIILMGDAPPHEPEPESGYVLAGVVDEANAGGISTVTAKSLGSGSSPDLRAVLGSAVDPSVC